MDGSNTQINLLNTNTYKKDILVGIKIAIPICMGYIPLGIACGILSQKLAYHHFSVSAAKSLL